MYLRRLQTRALVRGISEYIRSLVVGNGLVLFANVTSVTVHLLWNLCTNVEFMCQIQHWKEYFSCFSVGHITEAC